MSPQSLSVTHFSCGATFWGRFLLLPGAPSRETLGSLFGVDCLDPMDDLYAINQYHCKKITVTNKSHTMVLSLVGSFHSSFPDTKRASFSFLLELTLVLKRFHTFGATVTI